MTRAIDDERDSPTHARYVLLAEVWHPSLTPAERRAMSTLFAMKDLFVALELKCPPFGFSDTALEEAVASGDCLRLDFWRELGAT